MDGALDELIDHRQHFPLGSAPVLDLIHKNLPALNDAAYLRTLIYFSQISQAMTIKAETENYRIEQDGLMNTMGALYWQLNDVWVAPSWSSIEFNGNYKVDCVIFGVDKFQGLPCHTYTFADLTTFCQKVFCSDCTGCIR